MSSLHTLTWSITNPNNFTETSTIYCLLLWIVQVYLSFQDLKNRFSCVRKVRGDGNCFYRAFGFRYFETLIDDKSDFNRQVHVWIQTSSEVKHTQDTDSKLFQHDISCYVSLLSTLNIELRIPAQQVRWSNHWAIQVNFAPVAAVSSIVIFALKNTHNPDLFGLIQNFSL